MIRPAGQSTIAPMQARTAGTALAVWLRLALALLAAGSGGGCAGFRQDVHLSPFFSNLSRAGGGRELEAVAGVVRVRRKTPFGPVSEWAIRPLVSQNYYENGDSLARFLVPLGTRKIAGDERILQLLPLARYQQDKDEEGKVEWRLIMLPGVLWSKESSGRVVRAVFPFGGVIERFITFDRIVFALWPLWMKTERAGRTSYHFLFPVFAYGTGGGAPDTWRVWPLWGRTRTRHYDRSFFLWPIFHWHKNDLRKPEEVRNKEWMVFPLFGRASQGTFRAWSVLWPFFGYSKDPATGFWAWDGPWPLVRFRQPGPGQKDEPRRWRVWPFWSHYEGDGLESTWYLWPLLNYRTESYGDHRRDASRFTPFWQSWQDFDLDGGTTGRWEKLWPVYQNFEDGEDGRFAFPALNPLWHLPVIDDHYAFVYELYTKEKEGAAVRERSWGGIWRREVDSHEERVYLSGLWSRRRYRDGGIRVQETSILLGLIRWRSREGGGFGLLAPALPGPGWPAERSTETLEVGP